VRERDRVRVRVGIFDIRRNLNHYPESKFKLLILSLTLSLTQSLTLFLTLFLTLSLILTLTLTLTLPLTLPLTLTLTLTLIGEMAAAAAEIVVEWMKAQSFLNLPRTPLSTVALSK
jgi:hypothetical protein